MFQEKCPDGFNRLDDVNDLEAFLAEMQAKLKYAFQPIIDIKSGQIHGVEALLRGNQSMGFETIKSFFDHAFKQNMLYLVDRQLRRMAIAAFAQLDISKTSKLFYNIDGRLFELEDISPDWSRNTLAQHSLDTSNLIFELSEAYHNANASYFNQHMEQCLKNGIGVALDDFGQGFSEMRVLYEQTADYIKIDRLFIDGISKDRKKELFTTSIISLSRVLGLKVVAEGVETKEDYLVCRNLGCDLLQGYYIQRPTLDHSQIRSLYTLS